jgi:hypothetical protein
MFIQVIQGRCTRQDEARACMDRWVDELANGATGWLGATYGFTDDDMLVSVVRFDSRDAAMSNSERPEQGEWWAEMEQTLDGPAEFHDSDDVTLFLDGGSDDAGFVQVIRGKAEDPARLKAMLSEGSEELRQMRPDILGGTLALEPDGTYTQTIAFSSEEEARKYESQGMPEDRRQEMESVMGSDVRYFDLHHPWFASPR